MKKYEVVEAISEAILADRQWFDPLSRSGLIFAVAGLMLTILTLAISNYGNEAVVEYTQAIADTKHTISRIKELASTSDEAGMKKARGYLNTILEKETSQLAQQKIANAETASFLKRFSAITVIIFVSAYLVFLFLAVGGRDKYRSMSICLGEFMVRRRPAKTIALSRNYVKPRVKAFCTENKLNRFERRKLGRLKEGTSTKISLYLKDFFSVPPSPAGD